MAYTQPYGGFKEMYPRNHGIGGTFGFTVRPQAGYASIEIGAEASYLPYGIEKHQVGSGSNAYYLKTTHSLIPLHAFIRLKPRRFTSFNPYLDALAGIIIFNSRTKIKEGLFEAFRDKEAVVVRKHNLTVFNYGLAASIMIGGQNRKNFFADLRFIYLESPLASFVKRGDVTVDQNGNTTYRLSHSKTSMLVVQLKLTGIIKSPVD